MTATDSRHRGLVKDRGQGGPILIADDNAVTRALIATVLQHAGFGVTEAESGDEAIDLARRERPSVVILEVNLPALSGYEVCCQLREAYGAGLPVILVYAER